MVHRIDEEKEEKIVGRVAYIAQKNDVQKISSLQMGRVLCEKNRRIAA